MIKDPLHSRRIPGVQAVVSERVFDGHVAKAIRPFLQLFEPD